MLRYTRQGVYAVNVHPAGAAYSFPTGPSKGQRLVHLAFYVNQRVQVHVVR